MYSLIGGKLLYNVVLVDAVGEGESRTNGESSINVYEHCVRAKSLKFCLSLCDPMDCSPSDSSVCGNLQARTLGRLSCPLPGDLPDPGIKPTSLAILALPGGFLTTVPPGKPNPFLQFLPGCGILKAHRAPSSSASGLWHQNRWSLYLQKSSDAPALESATNISFLPPPNCKT